MAEWRIVLLVSHLTIWIWLYFLLLEFNYLLEIQQVCYWGIMIYYNYFSQLRSTRNYFVAPFSSFLKFSEVWTVFSIITYSGAFQMNTVFFFFFFEGCSLIYLLSFLKWLLIYAGLIHYWGILSSITNTLYNKMMATLCISRSKN